MGMLSYCSCGRVFVGIVLLFLVYQTYVFYKFLATASCDPNQRGRCLIPVYKSDTQLQLWVFYSKHKTTSQVLKDKSAVTILQEMDLNRTITFEREVNVSLPNEVKNNGTLFAHIMLGPKEKPPHHPTNFKHFSTRVVPLTKYQIPSAAKFNLITGEYENVDDSEGVAPVTHWIPALRIHCVAEDWMFDKLIKPIDLFWSNTLIVTDTTYTRYLPLLYINELSVLDNSLLHVTKDNATMPLVISYSPVGLGHLRVWIQLRENMKRMKMLGFQDKDLEMIKELIFGNSLYLLGLTFFISFFHLLFDGLAFKNDIYFWRRRKTMVGLSTKTVLWKCFSYTVVFLYLQEEEASLLILIPAGIAAVIEFWKATKILHLQLKWSSWIPRISFGKPLKEEAETTNYDSLAMYYLSYLLVPLVMAGAVYSLLYLSYKSWYSWIIHSLVNGVYAFGFLFMLPQLFVNYKLKSVAHLPWRAFMYKAFNTFIDDVFAFIITMPTSHRVAVFRDDLVFIIYLYQRWLYPVDRSRTNEFGESFKPKEHKD